LQLILFAQVNIANMKMSLVPISDQAFSYAGSYDNIFEHVSFRVDMDWQQARPTIEDWELLREHDHAFCGRIDTKTAELEKPI
jgi:hypothetical protein